MACGRYALDCSQKLATQLQRVGHVLPTNVCAELPRDDVTAVVVENRVEVEPAATNNLDVDEDSLPKPVDCRCLVFELVRRLEYDERWAGDHIIGFQHAIHRGFRNKIALLIGKRHRQLAWLQLRLPQGEVDNLAFHLIRHAAPDLLWLGRSIFRTSFTPIQITSVPAIERC